MPAEDVPPQRFCQSKSNPVNLMVLVGVMKPRGSFDGVVAMHSFVHRVAAQRSSKRRESGVIELKSFNVTGEAYLAAWRSTMLPALKRLVLDGSIQAPTANAPLLLQDDNAKPHRKKIDGVLVSDLVCRAAFEEFGLAMQPLRPPQPAQSPDLNPLDLFVFRLLALRFRRLRAVDRARRSAGQPKQSSVRILNFLDEENVSDLGPEVSRPDQIPLRCGPSANSGRPSKSSLCPACLRVVKETDQATQCDLRQGWWHDTCVDRLRQKPAYFRALPSAGVAKDRLWICPQCSHHLCRNDDLSSGLCLVCGLPSTQTDVDDMVSCSSAHRGLFHKSCLSESQLTEISLNQDSWLCMACAAFADSPDANFVDDLRHESMSRATVASLEMAVRAAFDELSRISLEKGFETRRAVMQKIVESEGGNTYDLHWRNEEEFEN